MSLGSVMAIALGFRSPMPFADPERPSPASNASARASRAPRDKNSRDMSPPCVATASLQACLLVVFCVDVVFRADELDELVVRHQPLWELHRPRTRVRLGVVDGDVDLERAVVHAPETLGHPSCVGERAAVDVEPSAVAEPTGFDDQR